MFTLSNSPTKQALGEYFLQTIVLTLGNSHGETIACCRVLDVTACPCCNLRIALSTMEEVRKVEVVGCGFDGCGRGS